MNEQTTIRNSKTLMYGIMVGFVILMHTVAGFSILIYRKMQVVQNQAPIVTENPPTTAETTTPTSTVAATSSNMIEQEFTVYSYGSSTVKETVNLPASGVVDPNELRAYLQSRWAFHAAKEPVCTFVRDTRFLKGERIASFDMFRERVCLYVPEKEAWEAAK